MKIRQLLFCIIATLPLLPSAQTPTTGVDGIVVDARTAEPIPFAHVGFVGTKIVAVTDMEGHFSLENQQGLVTVSASIVGYKKRIFSLKPNKTTNNLRIELEPDVYNLGEVQITASRHREHYSRKNNPAVELVSDVIAHKDAMRPDHDSSQLEYEKLILALDQFNIDYNRWRLLEKFAFIEHYVDTAQFTQTPVLNISLRESLYGSGRQLIERRSRGLDNVLESEGLSSNLDAMFTRVDIFDNSIDLMLNRFVSPLASTIALAYYHFYIEDTTAFDHNNNMWFRPMKLTLGIGWRW